MAITKVGWGGKRLFQLTGKISHYEGKSRKDLEGGTEEGAMCDHCLLWWLAQCFLKPRVSCSGVTISPVSL